LVRDRLAGGRGDLQSRYLEVITCKMLLGCIYLPNGIPVPGGKSNYKMKWFERLKKHAKFLLSEKITVTFVGDYNVILTESTSTNLRQLQHNQHLKGIAQ